MSWKDSIHNIESNVHTHDLPAADPAFCSCCRKGIVSGLHNVVRVNKKPEVVLDLNGNQIGTQGEEHPKAFFHAQCFQENHVPSKKKIECAYCGAFSMAKKFADGTENGCVCSCHKAGDFCSLIITSA